MLSNFGVVSDLTLDRPHHLMLVIRMRLFSSSSLGWLTCSHLSLHPARLLPTLLSHHHAVCFPSTDLPWFKHCSLSLVMLMRGEARGLDCVAISNRQPWHRMVAVSIRTLKITLKPSVLGDAETLSAPPTPYVGPLILVAVEPESSDCPVNFQCTSRERSTTSPNNAP